MFIIIINSHLNEYIYDICNVLYVVVGSGDFFLDSCLFVFKFVISF